jgi:mRNA interferase RelE/StbE
MKAIQYSRDAKKSLDRMRPKRRLAIIAKLEAYARGESVDIKKMQGSQYYRIRVGQDRVIIDDQGIVVMVIDAGPRGGIYKE